MRAVTKVALHNILHKSYIQHAMRTRGTEGKHVQREIRKIYEKDVGPYWALFCLK
jgi:hypothetical protein